MVRSSSEEVSKIRLSYRLIKKDDVSYLPKASVIETKIEYDALEKQEELVEERLEDIQEEEAEDKVSYEELIREAQEKKELIIKKAMKETEEIRQKAREEAYNEGFNKGLEDGLKKGFEEGKAKGFESGYKAGMEEAQKEAQEIRRKAIELFDRAEKEVDKYIKENEDRIVRLAAQMAESIVHQTIDTSSDNILQLIKPILLKFKRAETIIISCHPENYDFLKKSIYELEQKYEDTRFIILEDESLEKNGCVIENEHQIIDLQIRKQLDNILQKLTSLE